MKNLIKKLFNGNLNYPLGGEVFESIKDTKISYLTYFMAPYTGGAKSKLKKGERIIIGKPNRPSPSGYYCYPLNADEIEKRIIPKKAKNDPKYNGFGLHVETKTLNKDFRKIQLEPIRIINGDATNPSEKGTKVIVHICNDTGGWGKGFVLAISGKWKMPEQEYRSWFKSKEGIQSVNVHYERLERRDKYSNEKKFELGNVQFVQVSEDIWVANMLAQYKTRPNKDGLPPIRYTFVSECLERVREFAKSQKASIHMPRIGCGLAGGEWNRIEEIVNSNLIAHEIATTVYDFE